jgi:hypothetical protein
MTTSGVVSDPNILGAYNAPAIDDAVFGSDGNAEGMSVGKYWQRYPAAVGNGALRRAANSCTMTTPLIMPNTGFSGIASTGGALRTFDTVRNYVVRFTP